MEAQGPCCFPVESARGVENRVLWGHIVHPPGRDVDEVPDPGHRGGFVVNNEMAVKEQIGMSVNPL